MEPGNRWAEPDTYSKVQEAVNKKLKKIKDVRFVQFGAKMCQESRTADGIHWTAEGRERVLGKFKNLIIKSKAEQEG